MKTQSLSIDLLRLDGDTQSRTAVHEDTVAEYAEIITASGSQWPFGPVEVFHDGSSYFVSDGFHRTLAANKAGRASVPCVVKKGTAREARISGMLANDQHGLRPSAADRRFNVNWLLDTFKTMTQAEIAKNTGASLRTVKMIVAERKPQKVQIAPSESAKPAPKPEPEAEEPDDSESEIESPSDSQTDVLDDEGEPDDEQVPDDTPDLPQASVMLDALGKQIPKNLRSASELAIQLQATGRELDKYRKLAKDFAEQPGGEWISVQDIDAAVRTLKGHFQSAQFHCVCPRCNGKGCERCDNTGWLPEHRKNIL